MDIVNRRPIPQPWAEGEKIPWNDADFSRRMLREHLSQHHDLASRRFAVIDQHVAWIHHTALEEKPSRILDLGCGPGLYASRLARLGHACTGIDFSPASIEYAQNTAKSEGLSCVYHLEDVRAAEFGQGYDLAMFIFGEFNVFKPAEAQAILIKAAAALRKGGRLLLEVSTYAGVKGLGHQPQRWSALDKGLFSDRPHLLLSESFWDAAQAVATERYYVVDAHSGQVTAHAASSQAYRAAQLKAMLVQAGFNDIRIFPSLTGEKNPWSAGLTVLLAQR